MNINRYAIPGLMPTTATKEEARVFTNPDGSLMLKVYTAALDEPTPNIQVAVTTQDNRFLLLDTAGLRIYPQVGDGKVCYYFLVDGIEEVYPVGTSRVDALVNGTLYTWYVTMTDNPFAQGANSNYKTTEGGRIVYLMKGSRALEAGTSNGYLQYPRAFSVSPDLITARVTNGTNNIRVSVDSTTAQGFNYSLETTTPDASYSLDWVVWTGAAPLSLMNLYHDLGPFYATDDFQIGEV